MSIHKNVENIINSTYQYCIYRYWRLREKQKYGDYGFPYNESLKDKCVYVLANGPSLKADLVDLVNNKLFQKSPKIVVNGFASSSAYNQLKPEYYCIADPAFFLAGSYNDRAKAMLADINDKTEWEMQLFVPNKGYSVIRNMITNNKIKIISISPLVYRGFKKYKYMHYKKGLASPCFVNVTIMIEYILLNLGCKDIRLYGVDHTFTEGLVVDSNNNLCIADKHFYGNEFRKIIAWDGRNWTIAEYLYDKFLTFKEHENMRGYADFLGAQIINCTECSLIDAYVRLSQIKCKE